MTENPIETVKGTPGSAEPTEDEKKTASNQEAESREHAESSAGSKPGEAEAPVIPDIAPQT